MTDDDLYRVRVTDPRGGELVNIVGARETVVDVALRVILDSAPLWNEYLGWQPTFQAIVWKATKA